MDSADYKPRSRYLPCDFTEKAAIFRKKQQAIPECFCISVDPT